MSDKINYLIRLHYPILEHITEDNVRTSPRILIVDDDPDITLTFKLGLEKKGFIVTVFNA